MKNIVQKVINLNDKFIKQFCNAPTKSRKTKKETKFSYKLHLKRGNSFLP